MYSTIPIGPISLPTGPILALLAVWLGLDLLGRYGNRWQLDPDELWNVSLIGLTAGLIVARLWNVVQFWPVYADEPLLILSVRPGGLVLGPGLTAAAVAGYAYLIYRRLPPAPVAASVGVGLLAAGVLLSLSAFLTGSLIGMPSNLPWALPFFDELRHPVALYQALGLILLVGVLWRWPTTSPTRTLLATILGYSLIRLVTDGFVADSSTISGLRISQIVALGVALICALLLARQPTAPQSGDTPSQPDYPLTESL